MEQWKSIPEFEGYYEASSFGRIRRIGRGRGIVNGRILKPQTLPAGYIIYSLWKNNKAKGRLAHRLVASAFIGVCPIGYEVNHKNSNKADNKPNNLEYLTRSENLLHRSELGIMRGENNPKSKLTEDNVISIRDRYSKGEGYIKLGRAFGVSRETIRDIIKGKIWSWL